VGRSAFLFYLFFILFPHDKRFGGDEDSPFSDELPLPKAENACTGCVPFLPFRKPSLVLSISCTRMFQSFCLSVQTNRLSIIPIGAPQWRQSVALQETEVQRE
jgi:hypothetical protein